MPKVKTHSGAKKRFKKLGNGGVKAAKPYRRHLLTKKSSKRKRGLRAALYFKSCDIDRVLPLLPY